MNDIGLVWNPKVNAADFTKLGNDLAQDAGLQTAVLLSVFTDAQANPGDVIPDGTDNRRGWWADELASVDGDKFGSRLWLLSRAKATADVKLRAVEYAEEALQWMIDDGVALAVDAIAEIMGSNLLALQITITRPGATSVSFAYNYNWVAQALVIG